MRGLSSHEVLQVWERSLGQSAAERALALLRAVSAEEAALLPLGERDARLLSLREATFGSRIVALAKCPRCGEDHEVATDLGNLRVSPQPAGQRLSVTSGEYAVEFRLPNSLDLCALGSGQAPGEVSALLLQRCVSDARRQGQPVAAADLPGDIVEEISRQMSEADPQAELELSLECAACHHRWLEPFDIASFFWNEIEACALRTLYDVHQLAAAYGWSEFDILAMSPTRRNLYLNLLAG